MRFANIFEKSLRQNLLGIKEDLTDEEIAQVMRDNNPSLLEIPNEIDDEQREVLNKARRKHSEIRALEAALNDVNQLFTTVQVILFS